MSMVIAGSQQETAVEQDITQAYAAEHTKFYRAL